MKWKPPFRGHSGTLAHRGVLSLDGSSHGADSRPGSTSSLVTPSEDGPRLLRSRGKPDSATGAMALGVACFGGAYLGFALSGSSILLLAVCFVVAGIAIGFR